VLKKMNTTKAYCSYDTYKSSAVERYVLAKLHWPLPEEGVTEDLDNVDNGAGTQNCQNEPPAIASEPSPFGRRGWNGLPCRVRYPPGEGLLLTQG
jgi:hypothetical protein